MPTYSGPMSKAQANLEATLADSTNFRTWAGAADQAAALARIYHDAVPRSVTADSHTLPEAQSVMPYAIVWTESFASVRDAESDGPDRSDSGVLGMELTQELALADKNDIQEAGRKFMNALGQILEDLYSLSGGAGYLVLNEIEMPEGWTIAKDDVSAGRPECMVAAFLVDWGAEVS